MSMPESVAPSVVQGKGPLVLTCGLPMGQRPAGPASYVQRGPTSSWAPTILGCWADEQRGHGLVRVSELSLLPTDT